MMNKQQILELIRSRRKNLKLTQKDMADKLDIEQTQYSRYELDKSEIGLDKLIKIGEILELDIYMESKNIQSLNEDKTNNLIKNLLHCIDITKSIK